MFVGRAAAGADSRGPLPRSAMPKTDAEIYADAFKSFAKLADEIKARSIRALDAAGAAEVDGQAEASAAEGARAIALSVVYSEMMRIMR